MTVSFILIDSVVKIKEKTDEAKLRLKKHMEKKEQEFKGYTGTSYTLNNDRKPKEGILKKRIAGYGTKKSSHLIIWSSEKLDLMHK